MLGTSQHVAGHDRRRRELPNWFSEKLVEMLALRSAEGCQGHDSLPFMLIVCAAETAGLAKTARIGVGVVNTIDDSLLVRTLKTNRAWPVENVRIVSERILFESHSHTPLCNAC